MKLLSKERDGKKVRCVYDPAKTLLQRLLLSSVVCAQQQQELTEVAQALDPIRLFQQVEQLQQAVFRCAVNSSPFVPSIPPTPLRTFSVERCIAGAVFAERSVPDPAALLEAVEEHWQTEVIRGPSLSPAFAEGPPAYPDAAN